MPAVSSLAVLAEKAGQGSADVRAPRSRRRHSRVRGPEVHRPTCRLWGLSGAQVEGYWQKCWLSGLGWRRSSSPWEWAEGVGCRVASVTQDPTAALLGSLAAERPMINGDQGAGPFAAAACCALSCPHPAGRPWPWRLAAGRRSVSRSARTKPAGPRREAPSWGSQGSEMPAVSPLTRHRMRERATPGRQRLLPPRSLWDLRC